MNPLLDKYFPGLTPSQQERFDRLEQLYVEWNARINVISRRDMENFYERHVLHSLAIAKVCAFAPGARVLDAGTGGGFPGIPLAIIFPESRFTLCDSIAKKMKVAAAVTEMLELENVTAVTGRAESLPGRFDYVVTRAVAPLKELLDWTWSKIESGRSGDLSAGMLCLKGGDLSQEIAASGKKADIFPINGFFKEEFFETKNVVYIKKG